MSDQWVIHVQEVPGAGIDFRPDLPGANPGDALQAKPNDLVLWSNSTDRDIELESLNPAGLSLDQLLPAGETSASLFTVPDVSSIEYRSKEPTRTHFIKVTSTT